MFNPLEATCEICEITFMTKEKRDAHLTSKRHRKTVIKKKATLERLVSASVPGQEVHETNDTNVDALKEDANLSMHVQDEVMDTIEEIAKEIVLTEKTPIQVESSTPISDASNITDSESLSKSLASNICISCNTHTNSTTLHGISNDVA